MTADAAGTIIFANRSVKVLPFIIKDGIRFGSGMAGQTSSDQFAGIVLNDTRHSCKLLYHFKVHIPHQEIPFYCSAVQRMVYDEELPSMPWDRLYVIFL